MKKIRLVMLKYMKKDLLSEGLSSKQFNDLYDCVSRLPEADSYEKTLDICLFICSNLDKISVQGVDNRVIAKVIKNTMKSYLSVVLDEYVVNYLKTRQNKKIREASSKEICYALSKGIRVLITDEWNRTNEMYDKMNLRRVYYLSMEFLLGRALSNNMLNLVLSDMCRDILAKYDVKIDDVINAEMDPGLGNGGLGRLASCFLDSAATLGLPVTGCGIRYQNGLFKQVIKDGKQTEEFDNWLVNGNPWEVRRDDKKVVVKYYGYVNSMYSEWTRSHVYKYSGYEEVTAVPYYYPIVGYKNGNIVSLWLWSAEYKKKMTFEENSNSEIRRREAIKKDEYEAINDVLYPNDNTEAGKILRIKQEYFFVSATIQRVIMDFVANGNNIRDLASKVVFQLNDTHPAVAVPELMRILIDDYSLGWEEACNITKKTCAYTNHTVLQEALEKWDTKYYRVLLPRVYDMIQEIDRRFVSFLQTKEPNIRNNIGSYLVINNDQVRMANLASVGCYSINGVAKVHSDILKDKVLSQFYTLYPEKFNNKTNGITQRRFLALANPMLSQFITERIGDEWITDLYKLKDLEQFADQKNTLNELEKIKKVNKETFCKYVKDTRNMDINPNSVYVTIAKRFHEYKRQQMVALAVLMIYNMIKKNEYPKNMPHFTVFFAGKAASGYKNAKEVIELVNRLSQLINHDNEVNKFMNVYFLENYDVSLAEKLVPATDISLQVSTAGKEASGTGNMKFMLNGAITLGTLDGANIEICEEAGIENEYIFGYNVKQIEDMMRYYVHYKPKEIMEMNYEIEHCMKQLVNGALSHDRTRFTGIYNSIVFGENGNRADQYFVLGDLLPFKNTLMKALMEYQDKEEWYTKSLLNIARAGKFSIDRTILEYAKDIWHIDQLTSKIRL